MNYKSPKNKTPKFLAPRQGFAETVFGYWIFALLFWETLLHAAVFGEFGGKFGYVVGFSVSAGLLLALLVSFLNRKGAFLVNLLLTLVMTVLYGSQIVYNSIFGTLYSLALMGQGGQAVTSFWRETLSTMAEKLPWLLALLVPLLVLLLLRKQFGKSDWFSDLCSGCCGTGVFLCGADHLRGRYGAVFRLRLLYRQRRFHQSHCPAVRFVDYLPAGTDGLR